MYRLPRGLDPVTAGRFGLWLLGRRQQTAASKRIAFPRRGYARLIQRACGLLVPWRVHEYPGVARWLASVCGVADSTAANWLKGSQALPRKHAETVALYLENHSALLMAAAVELRAYAQTEQTKGQVKGTEKNRRRSNARAA